MKERRDQIVELIRKEMIGPDPIDWEGCRQDDGEEILLGECLLDPSVSVRRKIRLLKDLGAVRSANHEDIPLYSLNGRYLFIAVEIVGDAEAILSRIRNETDYKQAEWLFTTGLSSTYVISR